MNVDEKRLNIYITETGYELDCIDEEQIDESLLSLYKKDKYEFLIELAFLKEAPSSISLSFLQFISRAFLQAAANDPRFNFAQEPFDIEIDENNIKAIIENTPYIIGAEFVNKNWVLGILSNYNTAYKKIVARSKKSPLNFILGKGRAFAIPSRIYFHLVENKDNDNYPFAFLATYTALDDGKLINSPLKNAPIQLKANKSKLSALISSISDAAKKSTLIRKLVDNGSIFFPIKLNEYEAYTFLKEVPYYEQCGIVCRIPKWYTESTSKIQVDIDEKSHFAIHTADGELIPVPAMIYKGVEITPEEAQRLLLKAERLEIIKGKWVENNHAEIQQLLEEFDALSKEGTSLLEIFKMKSLTFKGTRANIVPIEFSQNGWIARLFQKNFDATDTILRGEI